MLLSQLASVPALSSGPGPVEAISAELCDVALPGDGASPTLVFAFLDASSLQLLSSLPRRSRPALGAPLES